MAITGNGRRIWSLSKKARLHHEQRRGMPKQAICGTTFFSRQSGHAVGDTPPPHLERCYRCWLVNNPEPPY